MGGVYRYDGSGTGLLTLLSRLVADRILPEAIWVEPPPQLGLFAEVTDIPTDLHQAELFWGELSRRLSPATLNLVRHGLLAVYPEHELMICRYLLLAWQVGRSVGGMLTHPQVAPLWKLAQQVGREAHRYKGFVRFQEMAGGYYFAAIAPEHRILPLIAPHFAAHFRDQHWVIHDEKHGEGVVHDRQRREWLLLPMERHVEPDVTSAEERFQALWRNYFAALAIAERENLRLQQSKVPLKVRPWLVEFG